jgi:CRP-like cAMP-binding protein
MPNVSVSRVVEKIDQRRRMRLLERGCPKELTQGEYLFFRDDPARRVWSLEAGVMKFCLSDEMGRPSLLGLATPGDVIGELAVSDGGGQPFDAVAATPCALISFDADDLMDAVFASPAASRELCAQMGGRARSVLEAVTQRSHGDMTARLAGRLMELAELLGRMHAGTIEMDVPLAQEDLGRLAGMCRESACRTMRQLKAEGVLDYNGRKMRILRPEVLERLRCGGRAVKPSR